MLIVKAKYVLVEAEEGKRYTVSIVNRDYIKKREKKMGTKSLTYVYDDDYPAVCLYGHYDGYVSDLGKTLACFLESDKSENNGMDCMAATLVSHLKNGVGGFYLHSLAKGNDCGQEFEYHIYTKVVTVIKVVRAIIKDDRKVIFSGTWKEFKEFCTK